MSMHAKGTIRPYTDGGVKNPENKWLATAGFGVWTPGVTSDEEGSGCEVELTSVPLKGEA